MRSRAARIGRIRLKSGGAEIRLFDRPDLGLGRRLVAGAQFISDSYGAELSGYLVIGWGPDGQYRLGWSLDKRSWVGPSAFPSYVGDIVRREVIAGGLWDD